MKPEPTTVFGRHLKTTAIILAFWGLVLTSLFKFAYGVLIAGLILFPWLLLAACRRSAGRRTTDESRQKVLRELLLLSFLSSVSLVVRAVLDFYVLNTGLAFFMALVLGSLLFFAFARLVPALRQPVNGVYMMIFMLSYAYGAVISVNCLLDTRTTRLYTAQVMDKQVTKNSRGNRAPHYHYYLQLAPWAAGAPSSIEVSKKRYSQTAINQELQLQVRPGLLGVAWFELPPL